MALLNIKNTKVLIEHNFFLAWNWIEEDSMIL